jgi:hypothetical protein
LSCAGEPEFDEHKDFVVHAKKVHLMKDGESVKGELVFHLDAQDYWETNEKFENELIKFLRIIRMSRTAMEKYMLDW